MSILSSIHFLSLVTILSSISIFFSFFVFGMFEDVYYHFPLFSLLVFPGLFLSMITLLIPTSVTFSPCRYALYFLWTWTFTLHFLFFFEYPGCFLYCLPFCVDLLCSLRLINSTLMFVSDFLFGLPCLSEFFCLILFYLVRLSPA